MAITYRETTLENGLRIAAEIDPTANSAAAGFFVKTGARDERSAEMGVSHFLEHMMFKGTEKRSAEDVDRDFDSIGVQHNAFTTTELTAFYAHGLPEYLEPSSEVLADILRPAIRQQDFDDEKQVIIEEIAMYRDQPIWVLYERAMEVFYGDHPLSHRVLGTDDTVGGMDRDAMLSYFQTRYSADNTILALAGRLDFDAMVEAARAHCGHWQRTDTARVFPDVSHQRDRFTVELPTINRHYVMMISPAPSLTDPRRYAAMMLTQILGDHDGSRLYWAMVETGLADEAVAQYEGHDGCGDYIVYCSCSPEDAERAEAAIMTELDGLVDSLTDDDLQRVRSQVATSVTLQGELPGGRMRRLGQQLTYHGTYRSLEDELTQINAVTLDDLRELAAEFPITNTVVGTMCGTTDDAAESAGDE